MTAAAHSSTTPGLLAPNDIVRRKLGLAVVLLLCVSTWALAHGYRGIEHDACLYTLQALARLRPDSLAQDVFLRFGSQDRFTLFSPIYAALIGRLGVGPAAAVLTLTFQLAFLAGATVLARRVMPTSMALLGVAVLLAIPGFYGADRVFRVVEPFVSPRMAAEALVLFALAAALGCRRKLALGLLAAAMLLHPVMAAVGFAALVLPHRGLPRSQPGLLLAGAGVLLAAAAAVIGRLDSTWLGLIEGRSPYAFLTHWSLEDWGRTAVPLATLAVGSRVLGSSGARDLCQAALWASLAGLALTLVGCDGLRLTLVTQLQPWRWLWLATTVAALLLPAIAGAGWQSPVAGKITTLLLVSTWIFAAGMLALLTSLAAVASLGLARYSARPELRHVLYGSVGLLLIAGVNSIASNLLFLESFYADPQIPLWIRHVAGVTGDGSIPVAAVLLATWLARHERGTPALVLLAALAGMVCIALFPDAWRRWSQQRFPAVLVAQFASWRALIPPGAAVFWSESALESWVLLERPSYLSVLQSSGMMFSRAAALELQRRADALRGVVPATAYLRLDGGGAGIGPSSSQLEQACATSEFRFLVTPVRLSWQPVAELPAAVWHSSGGLRLYRCSDRIS
jgi:hypothetical protein